MSTSTRGPEHEVHDRTRQGPRLFEQPGARVAARRSEDPARAGEAVAGQDPVEEALGPGRVGREPFADARAEAAERLRRLAHGPARGRTRGEQPVVREPADAQPRHIHVAGVAHRRGPGDDRIGSAAGQPHAQRDVRHVAREHTHLARDRLLSDRDRSATLIGHAAGRRLEADDPAERGRDAAGSADVGPQSERRPAGRDDGGLSAGGATRRPFPVPWVPGQPVDRIVALIIEEELRHIRLGEDDGPGPAQARDVWIVGGRAVIAARVDPERRRRSFQVEAFLDGDRHAMERPERLAGALAPVGLARLRAGRVVALPHDRVEARVDLFDALDVRLDRLGSRDVPGRDTRRELDRRACPQRRLRPDLHLRGMFGHRDPPWLDRLALRITGASAPNRRMVHRSAPLAAGPGRHSSRVLTAREHPGNNPPLAFSEC